MGTQLRTGTADGASGRAIAERAQVGIGTLIVFIAMVLVAAIAAGVLINSAGFLQTKAEETGRQSEQQVTNRLQVTAATGTHLRDESVGVVNLTLQRAPGAGNVDLADVTVQWIGPSGTYNLVDVAVDAPGADGHFGIVAFKDADRSKPVINDPDDRMLLVFDLGGDDVTTGDRSQFDTGATGAGHDFFGSRLPEGTAVTVRVTTKAGATTQTQLTVPETIAGSQAVRL